MGTVVSIAVIVVLSTVLLTPVSQALRLSADSTALILGRTSVPTPDDAYVEIVKNQYIVPTHRGQDIIYIPVATPQEFWPLSALLFRLPGLTLGPGEIWGPGGPGWPDEPWWKLSGLFDLTINQSLRAGVTDLEQAMAKAGNDNLVIYGYSQGAGVANLEKRKLAEQYPVGTKAPDIDFVLGGDPNLPNGGVASRFAGLYLPILDWTFNGPAPTDTQFDTTVIVRQYDIEDFPLYPLNVVADLNALLGAIYVHFYGFDVSLAPDSSTSPAVQSQHGDTTYHYFPTADLPLFGPLRTLGVPEAVIDVVEPFFKVIVELGYDRSIPLWVPTPARLFPTPDPAKVATDLVNAFGEGIDNALALVGAPPLLSISESATTATPKSTDALSATEPAIADVSPELTPAERVQAKSRTETARADLVPEVTLTERGRPKTETETAMADVFPQGTTEALLKTGQAVSKQTPTPTNLADAAGAGGSELSLKPAEPTGQSVMPRPVVHGSRGAEEQVANVLRHGDGQRPTTTTAAPPSMKRPLASRPAKPPRTEPDSRQLDQNHIKPTGAPSSRQAAPFSASVPPQ
jgi:hypothetical protein